MIQAPETVYLVDDDPQVLRSLARLLGSAGMQVRAFASARSFLDEVGTDASGCVVLDLAMPGQDGLELQQVMFERGYGLAVVFLSGKGDVPHSVRALKRGAVDFLTKPVDGEALLAAVRDALERSRQARQARTERLEFERRLATLTPREREVLHYAVSGRLNKQIAHELGTVEKTIKVHRSRLMRKLGARSVAELARLADRAGLDPAPRGR
mgnify:FL=1